MKSYLQRLAARAEGHALTPSLFPSVRNEMSRTSEPDPFAAALESDESSVAQSSAAGRQVKTNDTQVTPALQYSGETVKPPAPVSTSLRSRRVQRSRAGQAPEQVTGAQPVAPKAESATGRREMATPATGPAAIGEGELRQGRDEIRGRAKPAKTKSAGRKEMSPPLLSHVNAGNQLFTGKRETGDQDEGRSNAQIKDELQHLTPRMEATERSTAGSRGRRRDVNGESVQTLEPRRADLVSTAFSSPGMSDESSQTISPRHADAHPAEASIPDEPRLVIGQLRVDVVAAPAETREVVRVVTRTVGSGRNLNKSGPLSKLRFGLGQM